MALANRTRRQFIASIAAAAASVVCSSSGLPARTQNANPRQLDLHHHFGSPRWIKRIAEIK